MYTYIFVTNVFVVSMRCIRMKKLHAIFLYGLRAFGSETFRSVRGKIKLNRTKKLPGQNTLYSTFRDSSSVLAESNSETRV